MRRYTSDTVKSSKEGELVLFIDVFNVLERKDLMIRKLSEIIEDMKAERANLIEAHVAELEHQAEQICKAAKWDNAESHPEEPTLTDDTDILILDDGPDAIIPPPPNFNP